MDESKHPRTPDNGIIRRIKRRTQHEKVTRALKMNGWQRFKTKRKDQG